MSKITRKRLYLHSAIIHSIYVVYLVFSISRVVFMLSVFSIRACNEQQCGVALLTLCGGGPEAGRQTQHHTPKQGQAVPFHSRPHSWRSKSPQNPVNKYVEGKKHRHKLARMI